MAQSDIPDGEHFLRFCHGRSVERDDNNRIVSVLPEAFHLRMLGGKPEEYLSGSHYEHFKGAREEKMKAALSTYRGRISAEGGVKSQDAIAILNAGDVRLVGRDLNRILRVLNEGKKGDRADYASIRNLPQPPNHDRRLSGAISSRAVRDVMGVSEIDSFQAT